MKDWLRRTVFFIVGIFIFSQLIVAPSYAAENYASGPNVTLPKGETVRGDYFVSGKTVVVDGNVDGDVYVAGGEVRIEGNVTGDVLATGGNIQVNGNVRGDVRAAGGQVLIAGNIGRNVSVAGGSISIQNQAKLPGNLAAAGGSLMVFAPIGGNMTFAGGDVKINNTIDGGLRGGAGQLTLLPQTRVDGNLDYWSQQKADVQQGASVSGTTTFHQVEEGQSEQMKKEAAISAVIFWFVVNVLGAFIVGGLLLSLARRYMDDVVDTVRNAPWLSLGIGALTVFVFPIGFLILMMTLVGIPLALILLMIFLVLSYLSKIVIAYLIGGSMLKNKPIWALLVGLIIYELVILIPIIGWIFGLIACLIGLGALLLGKKHYYALLQQKKIL